MPPAGYYGWRRGEVTMPPRRISTVLEKTMVAADTTACLDCCLRFQNRCPWQTWSRSRGMGSSQAA